MNRTDSIGLVLFTTISVAMDGWFLASRCEFSPPVHVTGTAVALLLQLAAISVPLVMNYLFVDASLNARIRVFGFTLLACLMSLPMMEMALVYGDSMGKEKGYPSVGHRCSLPIFPTGGPPNKRLQPTLGNPRAAEAIRWA
jgi:hypothetical protein